MSDARANSANPYTRMYTARAAMQAPGTEQRHIVQQQYREALAEIDKMTQEERTAALAAYDFELWEDEFQRWQRHQTK